MEHRFSPRLSTPFELKVLLVAVQTTAQVWDKSDFKLQHRRKPSIDPSKMGLRGVHILSTMYTFSSHGTALESAVDTSFYLWHDRAPFLAALCEYDRCS